MRNSLRLRWSVVLAGVAMLLALAACSQAEPEVVEVIKEVVVEKEVIREVEVPGETVVVEKEVIKEVEVPGETVVVEKEVVKEVEVEVVVEKEVVKVVEVPGETVFVEAESIKEVERTKPVYGGTLRLAITNDYGGTWEACTFAGFGALRHVYENLLSGDWAKGPSGTGENSFEIRGGVGDPRTATGAIADSWSFSDPVTYQFHIRPGLRWQDKHPTFGELVTPEQVAAEINRVKDCRWPRHDFLPQSHDAVTADDTDGDGIADSITYHTVKPISFWGYEMAWGPYFYIVSPHTLEAGVDDWRNQAGTGAWMASGYVPGSTVSFERNPTYHLTWTVDGREYGLPFIDGIQNIIIPQAATQMAALRTAKIDHLEGVQTAERPGLEAAVPELKKSLALGNSHSYYLPMNKPPFDDIRVRTAMQMALDRDVYIDAFHGGEGVYLVHPINPAFPAYYTPLVDQPESVQQFHKYNPEMARQLLDEAGLAPGADGIRFSVELLIRNDNQTGLDAAALSLGYWEDIGVKVTLDINDVPTVQSRLFENDYEMYSEFQDTKLTSMNDFRKGHQFNKPNLNDETWWALWEDVLTELDPANQANLVKQAMTKYLELAAGIHTPAGFEGDYWWPWLLNFNGERALNSVSIDAARKRFAYVWINRDLRAEETGFRD